MRMDMTMILWLILCGGYGGLLWAAKRRRSAGAALSFLDGFYLALLCFALLPCAMGTERFYEAAAASVLGVGAGFLLEKREKWHKALRLMLFAALTAFCLLHTGGIAPLAAVALAFFGGMGLYHACAGILPEDVPPRERIAEALLAGLGFFLGTICFAGLI